MVRLFIATAKTAALTNNPPDSLCHSFPKEHREPRSGPPAYSTERRQRGERGREEGGGRETRPHDPQYVRGEATGGRSLVQDYLFSSDRVPWAKDIKGKDTAPAR